MSGAAISVKGLRKSYGQHEAIAGIDFEVAAGEVFGFLGPNGVDPARPSREWRDRAPGGSWF